jgi:hypothetical protein
MPTLWGYTYSTTEMLIFSGEGWDDLPDKEATGPTSSFLGFALDGVIATPAAIGAAPGRLLSQYSLSIFEGHLRAATAIPNVWRWPSQSDGNWIVEFLPLFSSLLLKTKVPSWRSPVLLGGDPLSSLEVSRVYSRNLDALQTSEGKGRASLHSASSGILPMRSPF